MLLVRNISRRETTEKVSANVYEYNKEGKKSSAAAVTATATAKAIATTTTTIKEDAKTVRRQSTEQERSRNKCNPYPMLK